MYDAIIIGAGIGGLVCGCYLAKGGLKVLIIEQHNKPGGCCASFKRGNFIFDAAPHCFGSYREGGLMRKILQGIDINKRLQVMRPNPSDTIVAPKHRVSFWNDLEKTIEDFQTSFPEEASSIRKFFLILLDTDPNSFSRLRNCTFSELMDQYFINEELKALLSIPLLIIAGLPTSMISAFVGAKLYSEFLFDGGYVPTGGMQSLPNALASRFKEFGGELIFSRLVKRIGLQNMIVKGVTLDNGDFIESKYVISNCDARQTFFNLIGSKYIDREFEIQLENMVPSNSHFILYLGVDNRFNTSNNLGTVYFHFDHYDMAKAYQAIQNGHVAGDNGYAVRVSFDKSVVCAELSTSYKNIEFWKQNKGEFLDALIAKIEKDSLPNLSSHIIYKDGATPHTIRRYTLNHRGASFGWASTPSQVILPGFRKPSFIQNLYLAGHWTTLGVGISGVAYIGYDTANMIMKRALRNRTTH